MLENNFLHILGRAQCLASCLFSTSDFITAAHLAFLSILAEYEYLLISHIQYHFPPGLICLLLLSCFWPQLLTNLWEAWNVTANGIFNLPLLMHQPLNTKHLQYLSYLPTLVIEFICQVIKHVFIHFCVFWVGYMQYAALYISFTGLVFL